MGLGSLFCCFFFSFLSGTLLGELVLAFVYVFIVVFPKVFIVDLGGTGEDLGRLLSLITGFLASLGKESGSVLGLSAIILSDLIVTFIDFAVKVDKRASASSVTNKNKLIIIFRATFLSDRLSRC